MVSTSSEGDIRPDGPIGPVFSQANYSLVASNQHQKSIPRLRDEHKNRVHEHLFPIYV